MKTSLTFVLPKEEFDFQMALNGHKYYYALEHIDSELRNKLKYDSMSEELTHAFEYVRKLIREEKNEFSLD